MSASVVLCIVLAVALLFALIDGCALADDNTSLRVSLDRLIDDNDDAARARAAVHLAEVAGDLRAWAETTAEPQKWSALQRAAWQLENVAIPKLVGDDAAQVLIQNTGGA